MPTHRRSILITGASSGIGLAAAVAMAGRHWRVFATCRREEDRERLACLAGVEPVVMDYAVPATIAACAQSVLQATGGRLDALYNNGAFALPGALEDISTDQLRAVFEANVFGWHDLTRRIIPAMRAQGHGRIVMCSSVLGFMSMPHRGAYSASKYAVEALSDTFRLELRDSGIFVSTIEPGPIRTDFVAKSLIAFEAAVDVSASPFRDDYHRRFKDMAGVLPSRFSKPPEAVVRCLIDACESRRPRPLYRVTLPTRFAALAKRLLPTPLFVAFCAKAAKLER